MNTQLLKGYTFLFSIIHQHKQKFYERNHFSRRLRHQTLPNYEGDFEAIDADL